MTLPSLVVTGLPSVLSQLPIQGTLSLSRGFQEHPSATLALIADNSSIEQLRAVFRIGTELDLFDISFRVRGYSEQFDNNSPGGQIGVSISLTGKWEKYLNKAVRLRGGNTAFTNFDPFTDPDCLVYNNVKHPTVVASNNKTTINNLALQAGLSYSGPNFDIKFAQETSIQDTTTVASELDSVIPIYEKFLVYSDSGGVAAKDFNSVSTWVYKDFQLLTTVSNTYNREFRSSMPANFSGVVLKTIDLISPVPSTITAPPVLPLKSEDTNLIALPEYVNIALTGDFAVIPTPVATVPTITLKPTFAVKTSTTQVTVSGDPDPSLPPVDVIILKTLDLNFDKSGPTKTSTEVTRKNGVVTLEKVKRYGFAYVSKDIYKVVAGVPTFFGPANLYWKLIEEYTTTYNFDSSTGYLLGSDTSGKRLLRHNPENSAITANIVLGDPTAITGAEYNSYLFKYVPLVGATRYSLKQYRDYYPKFQRVASYEIYKVCNIDGTTSYNYKIDPNFVEPMFIAAESTETICYSSITNPLSSSDSPEPILTTGEDTRIRKVVQIIPSTNTSEDRYIEYISKFSAQDAKFNSAAETTEFTENTGMPPPPLKKDPAYARVPPLSPLPVPAPKQFKYVLYTTGINPAEPEQGSISFPKAKTIDEAMKGAKTLLKIQDMRDSVSTTFTVPFNKHIQEGDIVIFTLANITYKRRVLKADHQFIFNGLVDGQPYVTSPGTQLTLGIERDISSLVNYKKVPIPTMPASTLSITTPPYHVGFQLGGIASASTPGRGKA